MQTKPLNAEHVVEGAKLQMALNSETGAIFVDEMDKTVIKNIDIIFNPNTSDEKVINIVHETRGILGMLSGIGDKIALAKGIAARRLVNQNLRLSGKDQKEVID